MLQWLYMFVAKCRFQMFYLFFKRMSASVSCGCCICFTYILRVFYLDVTYVLQWFFRCFSDVFASIHILSVSSVFRRMLQMFYLDVPKVDRVLYMLQGCRWLATTFPLSANSLASAMALRGSPAAPMLGLHGRRRRRGWCGLSR
jgi:hypothetical protein